MRHFDLGYPATIFDMLTHTIATSPDAMKSSDVAEILACIEAFEMFSGLDGVALRALATHLILRDYAEGDVIFREGERGDWMGFLVSGEIRIQKEAGGRDSRVVSIESRARSIGEMALIDNEPRSATCIALRPSRLLILSKTHFERMATERPAVALSVILPVARLLSRRLRMTSGRLVEFLEE